MSCHGQYRAGAHLKDSVWPSFVYDTIYKLHSAGTAYWGHSFDPTKHIHYRITDSSNWHLVSIKDTADFKLYTYFRLLPYQYITDGGWDDLVGRFERQYRMTDWLLDSCKVTDTIPEKEQFCIPTDSSWIYQTRYFVGGMFGEPGRIVTDSVVLFKNDR